MMKQMSDGVVTMINQQRQMRFTAVKQEVEHLQEEMDDYQGRLDDNACTVGATTKYPDMPFDAYEKLRLERDALLVENTQLREHLDRLRLEIN
jgi:hypothetical protein